jgi:hypothetical protein
MLHTCEIVLFRLCASPLINTSAIPAADTAGLVRVRKRKLSFLTFVQAGSCFCVSGRSQKAWCVCIGLLVNRVAAFAALKMRRWCIYHWEVYLNAHSEDELKVHSPEHTSQVSVSDMRWVEYYCTVYPKSKKAVFYKWFHKKCCHN